MYMAMGSLARSLRNLEINFNREHYRSWMIFGKVLIEICSICSNTWYQVLGTNNLVPSTWYQVLGAKYLVPNTNTLAMAIANL